MIVLSLTSLAAYPPVEMAGQRLLSHVNIGICSVVSTPFFIFAHLVHGGIIACVLLVLLVWIYRRRSRRENQAESPSEERRTPFLISVIPLQMNKSIDTNKWIAFDNDNSNSMKNKFFFTLNAVPR